MYGAHAQTVVRLLIADGFFRGRSASKSAPALPVVCEGVPLADVVRTRDAGPPCTALLVPTGQTRVGFRLLYARSTGVALVSPWTDPDHITVRLSVDPGQPQLYETRPVMLRSATFHAFDFELPPWPVVYAELRFASRPADLIGVEFTSVQPGT